MKYIQERKVRVHYSEAFRLKVLDDMRKKKYTVREASDLYGVSFQSIYQWIRKYGYEDMIAKTVRIELKGEVTMNKKLQKENAELKDAVSKLTLENIYLKAELEVHKQYAKNTEKKSSFSTPSSSSEK